MTILEDRQLIWQAPQLLQDPFEISVNSPIDVDRDALTDGAIKTIVSMIFARNDPSGNPNSIVKAIKTSAVSDKVFG